MSEQFEKENIIEEEIILEDGNTIIDDIVFENGDEIIDEVILEKVNEMSDEIMLEEDDEMSDEIMLEEDDDPYAGILGKRIHLVMDEGEEMDTVVVSVYSIDEAEWDYIALLPIVEGENEDEGEVLLYRFSLDENGAPILGNIESDDEYEAAAEAFYSELEQYEDEFDGELIYDDERDAE